MDDVVIWVGCGVWVCVRCVLFGIGFVVVWVYVGGFCVGFGYVFFLFGFVVIVIVWVVIDFGIGIGLYFVGVVVGGNGVCGCCRFGRYCGCGFGGRSWSWSWSSGRCSRCCGCRFGWSWCSSRCCSWCGSRCIVCVGFFVDIIMVVVGVFECCVVIWGVIFVDCVDGCWGCCWCGGGCGGVLCKC